MPMATPKMVCIVDDDAMVHFTIKKMLQATIKPEEIIIFSDGEAIYEYLVNNAENGEALPDVMFLDLNMPFMDGWEFLNHYAILKPKLAKDIVIYVLSSSVSDLDILTAKTNPHVKDYIHKPITKSKIEEMFS
jgi:two-component system, chemotaxis family, chemotaxis protein CheY